jgi:hypothetical protein
MSSVLQLARRFDPDTDDDRTERKEIFQRRHDDDFCDWVETNGHCRDSETLETDVGDRS